MSGVFLNQAKKNWITSTTIGLIVFVGIFVSLKDNSPETVSFDGQEFSVVHEKTYVTGFEDKQVVQVLDVSFEKLEHIKKEFEITWETSPEYSTSSKQGLAFAIAFTEDLDPFVAKLSESDVFNNKGFQLALLKTWYKESSRHIRSIPQENEIYSVELFIYDEQKELLYYIFSKT